MSKLTAIVIATLTVLFNGIIDHFFAPYGIMFTPIVLTITSLLIAFGAPKVDLLWVSFLTFLFAALNDVLIKLYGGGSHDAEGQGWIHFLLFIGLVPTTAILLTSIFRRKEERMWRKIVAVFLFGILVVVYLQFFQNLGLGRYY